MARARAARISDKFGSVVRGSWGIPAVVGSQRGTRGILDARLTEGQFGQGDIFESALRYFLIVAWERSGLVIPLRPSTRSR